MTIKRQNGVIFFDNLAIQNLETEAIILIVKTQTISHSLDKPMRLEC